MPRSPTLRLQLVSRHKSYLVEYRPHGDIMIGDTLVERRKCLTCWRCAYDLSATDDDEVCPECGTPVRVSSHVAPLKLSPRQGAIVVLSVLAMPVLIGAAVIAASVRAPVALWGPPMALASLGAQ